MLSDQSQGKALSGELDFKPDSERTLVYQIRVRSHLDAGWTDWFNGLTVTLEDNGDTVLTGPVIDQAALHGLLKKVRDLGMALVSVNPVQPNEAHPEKASEK